MGSSRLDFTNKEAFNFAIAFIKGNWTLSLIAILILVALSFLSYTPLVGVLFILLYSIFSTSMQIYVARVAKSSYFIEDVEQKASNTSLQELFLKYIQQALGFSLGAIIISLTLFAIFGILFNSFIQVDLSKIVLTGERIELDYSTLMLFSLFFIISLWLSFITPAVIGYTFMADSFKDAFYRSFNMLNPAFWSKTLNGRYFRFISAWGLILLGLAIVSLLMFTTVILIPVGLVIFYFITLYNSIIFIYTQEKLG
jgi:hypothetical protein